MKLVAYLRVSTDAQAEHGLGLPVQERGIRTWAKSNGHRVVGWYRDEGISGSNGIEHRVGLTEALAALEDRKGAGLVVYRLDRLARNLTIQEATLTKAWSLGAAVFSVDLGEVPQDDPDDPMRTALRQMVGVFAQLERGMIGARLRAARRLKASRGGYAGYGSPPYGWEARDRELVEVPEEQAAIAEIVTLHRAGRSLREIAAELQTRGITPRRGDRWHAKVLARILARAGETTRPAG